MKKSRSLLLLVVMVAPFFMTDMAYSAIYIVDSLGDADDDNSYTSDDGSNTLRKCIRLANESPVSDIIEFAVFGVILPTSALPYITDDGTIIDASSQWNGEWPSGQPGVVLDGALAREDVDGFWINGADNCHIRGLFITAFSRGGVWITSGFGEGAQSNIIGGAGAGYRNVISGNGSIGVNISGPETDNNAVSGNYIGTDAAGVADLGNEGYGVAIGSGAQSNTIGGTCPDERNIISGNSMSGVIIHVLGTNNNVVSGNYIGTDVTGTAALGNSWHGIDLANFSQSSVVGGTTHGERNIISGNALSGIAITGSSTNNRISGNYIGTDVTGTADLGNAAPGIGICCGAQANVIGGTTPDERNIISGNDWFGIAISDLGDNNRISGNYIGTDVTGTEALGNLYGGVCIFNGAKSNTIGGATAGERNLISGNNGDGIFINVLGTNNNVVSGNYIGTDITGANPLGNTGNGVYIANEAQSNIIGGTNPGEGNIISGNSNNGVIIANSGTNGNIIIGNLIGTDLTGQVGIGNGVDCGGVVINGGPQNNIIGGPGVNERNVISGNHYGIRIEGPDTCGNIVIGNLIGTDITGTSALGGLDAGGHQAIGVLISGAKNNTVGGRNPGERNVISGNVYGVIIANSSTTDNKVIGNLIGVSITGATALGNNQGVYIGDGAQNNAIGGLAAGERNVISGNSVGGVTIGGLGTNNNVVSGNYIGTDSNGTAGLGNSWNGVLVTSGAQSNTISENLLAFNDQNGVRVENPDTDCNRITRNLMHDNTLMGIDLLDDGNNEIPAPTITSNDQAGNILTISGTGAGANATVEAFEADSFVSGEGMTYLGSLTADGSGSFSGTLDVTGKGLSAGDPLVATTTHTDGNTSEFSGVVIVNAAGGGLTVGDITGPIDPVALLDQPINVSAEFSDPGHSGHTAEWDWDDGSTTTVEGAVSPVSGNHMYTSSGVYAVTLTITDSQGCSGSSRFEYVVIYDPAGGFVTGGGWINSPAGAYRADPTLTGKANFGFVSKYKKGANVPTGNTEFVYHAGSLNFHSSVYQWLVVAGAKAMFKGDGTINGTGNYGFLLSAIDAALTPRTDADLFRIRIWDKNNGDGVVYDNQVSGDTGDNADPTTAIGGGSIVIHSDKDSKTNAKAAPALFPEDTSFLLPFPNPANPEVWIPYQLSADSKVVIRIYDITGRLVRVLDLGHRPTGFYMTREKAAYWDGNNEMGEEVSSGIYFYTIQAGDFTATKKMVIAK